MELLSKVKPRPKISHPGINFPGLAQVKLEADVEQLGEHLKRTLAFYVCSRAQEPLSKVLNDIVDLEIEAANLVDQFLSQNDSSTRLDGSLSSVFSFIHLGIIKGPRDITPTSSSLLKTQVTQEDEKGK